MKYNTGNPIGSADPRDLYDNATAFDNAMLTDKDTWIDRTGRTRKSIANLESDAAAAADAADAAEQYAEDARLTTETAQTTSNYKGLWSDLTGPLDIPAVVTHRGEQWFLIKSVPDVTSVTPSEGSSFWGLIGGDKAKIRVGSLRLIPVRAVTEGMLLADGSTVQAVDYPELVELLKPGGTSAVLPDETASDPRYEWRVQALT